MENKNRVDDEDLIVQIVLDHNHFPISLCEIDEDTLVIGTNYGLMYRFSLKNFESEVILA